MLNYKIHPLADVQTKNIGEGTTIWQFSIILKGASLGANSTIIGGITIGKYAMIGAAGSVVTKDVPDYALVYGNPAQIKGYVCECGTKLIDLTCNNCCTTYIFNDTVLNKQAVNDDWFYAVTLRGAA